MRLKKNHIEESANRDEEGGGGRAVVAEGWFWENEEIMGDGLKALNGFLSLSVGGGGGGE